MSSKLLSEDFQIGFRVKFDPTKERPVKIAHYYWYSRHLIILFIPHIDLNPKVELSVAIESDFLRGKSLQHLAYEICHFSKGFLAQAYEISDFLKGFPKIFKGWFTPRDFHQIKICFIESSLVIDSSRKKHPLQLYFVLTLLRQWRGIT